jgi:hypothetical protein
MSTLGAALMLMAEKEYHSEVSRQTRAEEAVEARKRYLERRQLALDTLGGKCQQCGATDRLRFHHYKLNGKAHRQEVGLNAQAWVLKVGAEEAKKELVLLCEHCHKNLHEELWQRTIAAANN